MTLAELLASFILGTVSTASLILLLAELKWRDPIFRHLHRKVW